MIEPARVPAGPVATLPAMVRRAAQRLASAESSAEVLDARDMAAVVYDAAKRAGRIARAKHAHDEVIIAVYHAQGDALEIEAAAKRRLADEYDAAQDRGEVRGHGERRVSEAETVGFRDLGLSGKDIHEARQLRDAEAADPGITHRTISQLIEGGAEPTKTAIRAAVLQQAPRAAIVSDAGLWIWGRLREFETRGYFTIECDRLFAGMTEPMRDDVERLAPLVADFLLTLEASDDSA